MIKGDAGMESIYSGPSTRSESFRGASGGGAASTFSRGIAVDGANPATCSSRDHGSAPRANPDGKTYGSNARVFSCVKSKFHGAVGASTSTPAPRRRAPHRWGFQPAAQGRRLQLRRRRLYLHRLERRGHHDLELASDDAGTYATPAYAFKWPTLTDPEGVERDYIKYPGTCVPHDVHGDTTPTSAVADMGWTKAADIEYMDDVFKARVPVNMHVGCMGLAPASRGRRPIPPMPSGGNLDDKRIGVGTTMYYPSRSPERSEHGRGTVRIKDFAPTHRLLAAQAHMAQGDSELDGRHRDLDHGRLQDHADQGREPRARQQGLDFPMGETDSHWIVHSFTEIDYLRPTPRTPATSGAPTTCVEISQ